jgi:hypothetical protein
MTSRQKIRAALEHRDGPVPVDFGATIITGMHVRVLGELRRRLGLEERPIKVHEPYQMLGLMDEDVKAALGVDTDGLFRLGNMFGVANRDWKPWKAPWGQDVLVPGAFATTEAGGEILTYPQGDLEAPPSGRMPSGGHSFDSIIRQPSIEESELDPKKNTVEFRPVSQEEMDHLLGQVRENAGSGRACVASVGGASFGDIAAVTAPFLKHPEGIRDPIEWYISIVSRPEYVRKVFERQCEVALENLSRVSAAMGDAIDVVVLSGTDFGTQSSLFFSVETFDALFAPFYRAINAWIHAHTGWKTFLHTDGAVDPLIPRLIDCGFDILNPVQYTARGMDTASLKGKYGKDLVFWGGGVETQHVLPRGTPGDVRRAVLEQCRILSAGGGFVFSSVHNILAGTPTENVMAMIEGVREFNGGGRP